MIKVASGLGVALVFLATVFAASILASNSELRPTVIIAIFVTPVVDETSELTLAVILAMFVTMAVVGRTLVFEG